MDFPQLRDVITVFERIGCPKKQPDRRQLK
jgi:hypothetical protein